MNRISQKTGTVEMSSCLVIALLLLGAITASARALENRPSQTSGADNTKMAPYRALAQQTYQAFQKGDYSLASQHARTLESAWDQKGGADKSLSPTVFQQIDQAMDAFIKPIMRYTRKIPDAASVEAAYKNYLEKLKEADSGAPGETSSADERPPASVHLSSDVLKTFSGKYQAPPPPGAPARTSPKSIEITANQDGLVIAIDQTDGHQLLPFSSSGELFSQEQPQIRFVFIKNEQGEVTGFSVKNFPPLQQATKLP